MASLSAEVELRFADGTYLFKLGLKQIEELQDKCGNSGFAEITNRVIREEWTIQDIYHSIRLGLIGGGLPPVKALELVDRYVDGKPLFSDIDPSCPSRVALAVLGAAYYGVTKLSEGEDKPPGKSSAGAPEEDLSMSRPPERNALNLESTQEPPTL